MKNDCIGDTSDIEINISLSKFFIDKEIDCFITFFEEEQ